MRVVLEAVDGPHRGQRILLRAGQTVRVGRTEWADVALPDDGHLSGVHFAVECGTNGCVVRDLQSTNGTTVNGKQVTEAALADGDAIHAGQTLFRVAIEAAAEDLTTDEPPAISSVADVSATVGRASAVGDVSATMPTAPSSSVAESSAPFEAGLRDEDPAVRREALLAAARAGQGWLLEHCRALCQEASPENYDAIWLLAVLGGPEDLRRLLDVGRNAALGLSRFTALGAYGHPKCVEVLLEAIEGDDPAAAAMAGAALTRITGIDVSSDETTQLPPEGGAVPDEFEREFLEEAPLPDAARARACWEEAKQRFAAGTRYCRGIDVCEAVSEEALAELDMQSRWEIELRTQFRGE